MNKKTITFWIDEKTHKQFKSACAKKGLSMQKVLEKTLTKTIEKVIEKG